MHIRTIMERQREGIAVAKKAGVYKGRKRSLTVEQVKEIRKRFSRPVRRRRGWPKS